MADPFPWPTATVKGYLDIKEHQVNHALLRAKTVAEDDVPPVVRGRRIWMPRHVRALANALGIKLTATQQRTLAKTAG